MATYVVHARIDGSRPRRAAARRPAASHELRRLAVTPHDGAIVDVRDDGRWSRLRELWAQTTFYLFDAESWR